MSWSSLLPGRKKPPVADGSEPQLVILIHGTGASEADPVTPKWWQPESDYAKDLRERMGPAFDVGETEESAPFKWSGANSERDRRRAGASLKQRLRALDKQGRAYHLIGHSHGGSVIWHALWQSASRKERPSGLKSWTTVGTPFLEFAPVWTGVTTFVPLAIAAILTFLIGRQAFTAALEHEIILRDGSAAGIAVTCFVGLILFALFLALAIAGVRWLGQWSARRRQLGKEKWAITRFADSWLGVWHPEDEPIAGLNASLISPMEFVPRLAKPTSNIFWRILTSPFNRVAAPVTDEFVWTLLMGRLQGSDLAGASMVDAGPTPRALAPGWAAMPEALVKDMIDSASQQAPRTVAALRARLAQMRAAGSGRDAVGELSAAVTWSEVLHTSYFDIPSVRELIAARVASAGRAPAADAPAASPSALETWVSGRPKAEPPSWPKPFTPVLLSFAKIGVFGGLAMLLFTAWTAAYDAYIGPHTRDGQLSILAENATRRETLTGRRVRMLGDILVKLDMLGKLGDPLPALDSIGDVDTRGWTAQRLAYHYGYEGRFAEVRTVADNLNILILHPADAQAMVYINGLAGARASDTKPDKAFLDTVATQARLVAATPESPNSVGRMGEDSYMSWPWVAVALPTLIHFQHEPTMAIAEQRVLEMLNSRWLDANELPGLLERRDLDCESIATLAGLLPSDKLPTKAKDALAQCKDNPGGSPSAAATGESPAAAEPVPPATVAVGSTGAPVADADPANGAPSASRTCPRIAELDEASPRVGGLVFAWSEAQAAIHRLLDDGCFEAAASKLKRHIPKPEGPYGKAPPGRGVHALAKRFFDHDKETAELIVRFNLPTSPEVLIPDYGRDLVFDRVNERGCLGFCSDKELLAIAKRFEDEARIVTRLREKSVIGTITAVHIQGATSYETLYYLGAALIYADLRHTAAAVADARLAMQAVPGIEPVDEQYRFAALIGAFARSMDKEFGLEALATSSALAYWSDLESPKNRKYRLSQEGRSLEAEEIQASIIKSAHHVMLADWYSAMGEYRLAREAAERATDKLPGDEQLGTGVGVLSAYRIVLDKAVSEIAPEKTKEFSSPRPPLIQFEAD